MEGKKRRIELRGLKATLLRSIIDTTGVKLTPVEETASDWPVLSVTGGYVELRPGAVLNLKKPAVRMNLFYIQGLGPVDLVPDTHDPLRAKIIRRWKFKF